jgi:hypothetical protein
LISPRVWLSAAAMLLAFSVCTPYVLLDYPTAIRDIQANRLIIVDRAQRVYGAFGSALPQVRYLLSQATLWIPAAVAGAIALGRASVPLLTWTASFPLVFFLFISNTWPFGRTANPLYPFLAILGAYGIVEAARRTGRHAAAVLALLVLAAVVQPLALSARAVYLLRQSDTRTLARDWIHRHVPDGASIAVEPYSVQLQPTRGRLIEALANAGLRPDQAGRRSKAMLARTPYPSPSYRLLYIGDGGMDEDKLYLPPEWFTERKTSTGAHTACVEWVVLKSAAPAGPNPLAPLVAQSGVLVHRETPFVEPGLPAHGWLPDTDVTPSLRVTRPGPVIEVWRTPGLCDATGAGR